MKATQGCSAEKHGAQSSSAITSGWRAERAKEKEQKLMSGHVDKDKVFTAQDCSHRPSGRKCILIEPLSTHEDWLMGKGTLINANIYVINVQYIYSPEKINK